MRAQLLTHDTTTHFRTSTRNPWPPSSLCFVFIKMHYWQFTKWELDIMGKVSLLSEVLNVVMSQIHSRKDFCLNYSKWADCFMHGLKDRAPSYISQAFTPTILNVKFLLHYFSLGAENIHKTVILNTGDHKPIEKCNLYHEKIPLKISIFLNSTLLPPFAL